MSQHPLNQLAGIIDEVCGNHDHSMSRDRPYTGQPHTITGERGATEIRGITFRDLRDAYMRAWCLCAGLDNPALYDEANKGERACICADDIYNLKGSIDPMAIIQNLACEIEKLMGIYPNV